MYVNRWKKPWNDSKKDRFLNKIVYKNVILFFLSKISKVIGVNVCHIQTNTVHTYHILRNRQKISNIIPPDQF